MNWVELLTVLLQGSTSVLWDYEMPALLPCWEEMSGSLFELVTSSGEHFLSWAYIQLAPLSLYGNRTSQLHPQYWILYCKCTIPFPSFPVLHSAFNPSLQELEKQANNLSETLTMVSCLCFFILNISVCVFLPSFCHHFWKYYPSSEGTVRLLQKKVSSESWSTCTCCVRTPFSSV